ncbi:uncharacterized protein LOC144145611 isoform X2 [Haemaphysalis longicornis]
MEGRQDAGDGVREEVAALESPNVRNNADLCLQLRPKLNYKPLFGQYKPLETLRKVEWAFILTSTLGLSASLGFCIRELVILPKNADDYTFSIMVCFTTVVTFYYIVHGVFKERWPELIVFIVSGVDFTVYLVLNVAYSRETSDRIVQQVRLGVDVFFLIVITSLGGWLVRDYYSRHEMVCLINCRSDAVVKLNWFFTCASLITLDWQLQASLTIFVLENGVAATPFEIIIVVGNAAVITLWIFAGYLTRAHIEEWTSLYQTTLAIVVASIANKLFLAVAMFVVVRNFGQGLKEAVEAVPTNHHPLIDEAEEDEEEPRRDTPAVCGGREPRLPCFHRSWSPEIRRLASTRETESPYP